MFELLSQHLRALEPWRHDCFLDFFWQLPYGRSLPALTPTVSLQSPFYPFSALALYPLLQVLCDLSSFFQCCCSTALLEAAVCLAVFIALPAVCTAVIAPVILMPVLSLLSLQFLQLLFLLLMSWLLVTSSICMSIWVKVNKRKKKWGKILTPFPHPLCVCVFKGKVVQNSLQGISVNGFSKWAFQ